MWKYLPVRISDRDGQQTGVCVNLDASATQSDSAASPRTASETATYSEGSRVRLRRQSHQCETSAPRWRSAGMCRGWWTESMPPSIRSRSSVRKSNIFGRCGGGAAAPTAMATRSAAASIANCEPPAARPRAADEFREAPRRRERASRSRSRIEPGFRPAIQVRGNMLEFA